jgi:hypothetical protein
LAKHSVGLDSIIGVSRIATRPIPCSMKSVQTSLSPSTMDTSMRSYPRNWLVTTRSGDIARIEPMTFSPHSKQVTSTLPRLFRTEVLASGQEDLVNVVSQPTPVMRGSTEPRVNLLRQQYGTPLCSSGHQACKRSAENSFYLDDTHAGRRQVYPPLPGARKESAPHRGEPERWLLAPSVQDSWRRFLAALAIHRRPPLPPGR